MNERVNRQWILRERPQLLVQPEHFELRECAMPAMGPNDALLRTLYLSFDPTQRGWLNDAPSYLPPVQLGEPMRAIGLAQVIRSNRDDLRPGDLLQGILRWQDYVMTSELTLQPLKKVTPEPQLTHLLSIYGVTGVTAYVGTLIVGEVRSGDVVVVSGAAGATGSVAGQLAKLQGADTVIGIAGGPDKCRWLIEEAGFDAAIDYRAEKVSARLRELAPRGIDLFFDNVGGEILEAALLNLAFRGRVVICGGIASGYGIKIPPGPKHYMQLVFKSASMRGFLLTHYGEHVGEAIAALKAWVGAGKICFAEDVAQGLEFAPVTLRRLFEGKNLGKQLLKVAAPPLPFNAARPLPDER
jgi:NADPH-dependent curcumin reductase